MTPAQRLTVNQLKPQGFTVDLEADEIVRVSCHGDKRVILRDGSQKRGHHVAPGVRKR